MSFFEFYRKSLFSNNIPSIFESKSLQCLNGLRAMAIIWVYVFHYSAIFNYKFFKCLLDYRSLNPAKNGDLGVDIFFVLSGYLITDILIKEIERYGKIDKFHFYRSRFFRIWPAMTISLLFTMLFGMSLKDVVLCLLFINNFFGVETHLWSVAVEFQFYLFSPFII